MRRPVRTASRGACWVALLALLAGAPGCQSIRRAFRPAPPTAVEEPAPQAADAPPEPAEPEPDVGALPVPEPEPPAQEPMEAGPEDEAAAAAEQEHEADPKSAAVAEAVPPRPESEPRPKPPPPARPALPELDAVSPVEAAPEPQLIEETAQLSQTALEARLAEADRLSNLLRGRDLSDELRAQVDSGRVFLGDARQALEARDLKRTQVLADKCLALLEDAERATRP